MALSKTYVLPLDPQMGCSNLDTAFRRESVDLTSIYFDVRVPAPEPMYSKQEAEARARIERDDCLLRRLVPFPCFASTSRRPALTASDARSGQCLDSTLCGPR